MTTKTHFVTHNGQTHTLVEWGDILGMSPHTLWKRLRRGLPPEQILATEKHAKRGNHSVKYTVEIDGATRALKDVAAEHGLSMSTVYQRIRSGWKIEDVLREARTHAPSAPPVAEWRTMDLPWRADLFAQNKVKEHPNGMELHEIADLMGVTKQRIEQIEKRALKKLQRIPGARALFEMALTRDAMRSGHVEPAHNWRAA